MGFSSRPSLPFFKVFQDSKCAIPCDHSYALIAHFSRSRFGLIQLHKYILIVFLLFLGLAPQAQNLKSQASIDVTYFGHGGIRPGFKIASSLPLYHWTPPQGDSIKFCLMARPDVAFYGRRNFYSTALGNLEYSLMRTQASSQNAWGINVGF